MCGLKNSFLCKESRGQLLTTSLFASCSLIVNSHYLSLNSYSSDFFPPLGVTVILESLMLRSKFRFTTWRHKHSGLHWQLQSFMSFVFKAASHNSSGSKATRPHLHSVESETAPHTHTHTHSAELWNHLIHQSLQKKQTRLFMLCANTQLWLRLQTTILTSRYWIKPCSGFVNIKDKFKGNCFLDKGS